MSEEQENNEVEQKRSDGRRSSQQEDRRSVENRARSREYKPTDYARAGGYGETHGLRSTAASGYQPRSAEKENQHQQWRSSYA